MLSSITDPAVLALLVTRRREREGLLARARLRICQDERAASAWLFGSLGRGTEDDLSDLDLFVAVEDYAVPFVIADHADYIWKLGSPLLVLDAPQNRPPGGAYNMALYRGQNGPHQVDWYWQPRSLAAIPAQTRVLFDRVGLPRLDTPPRFDYQPAPERTPQQQLTHQIDFFWVMLLIAAKYIARSPDEEGAGLLDFVRKIHAETRGLALPDALPTPVILSALPDFAAKLRLLRDLGRDMEDVAAIVARQGVPSAAAIVPPAYRYLDFVELLCRAQQS